MTDSQAVGQCRSNACALAPLSQQLHMRRGLLAKPAHAHARGKGRCAQVQVQKLQNPDQPVGTPSISVWKCTELTPPMSNLSTHKCESPVTCCFLVKCLTHGCKDDAAKDYIKEVNRLTDSFCSRHYIFNLTIGQDLNQFSQISKLYSSC